MSGLTFDLAMAGWLHPWHVATAALAIAALACVIRFIVLLRAGDCSGE